MNISLSSPAFASGEEIPVRYTREGENISPPLVWSTPPPGTKSFVIVCDEFNAPAGNVVHWIVYNVPGTANGLPERLPVQDPLPNGARQGLNDFNRSGYTGPMALAAGTHRYLFQVFALNAMIPAKASMTRPELIRAIESHVISRGRLIGTFTVNAHTPGTPVPAGRP